MDNEILKDDNLNEETAVQQEEEAVEETVTEETATEETVTEETAEPAENDAVQSDGETVQADEVVTDAEPAKKNYAAAWLVAAIFGGIIVVATLASYILLSSGVINPWAKSYIDTTGVTLEELADQSGYSVKEYKNINGLPYFMPKSTHENAVRNSMKLGALIKQSGNTIEDWRERYGWDTRIDENTTVGDALAQTPLSKVFSIGDDENGEYLAMIKDLFGLDDSVTADTLYGAVRDQIDQKQRETRLEQEASQSSADDESDASAKTDDDAKAEVEEQSAESAE